MNGGAGAGAELVLFYDLELEALSLVTFVESEAWIY